MQNLFLCLDGDLPSMKKIIQPAIILQSIFISNFSPTKKYNTTISFDSEKNCPRFDNEIFVILRNSGYQDCFFSFSICGQCNDETVKRSTNQQVFRCHCVKETEKLMIMLLSWGEKGSLFKCRMVVNSLFSFSECCAQCTQKMEKSEQRLKNIFII